MILVFLGSWRSTLIIAVSIPLSILLVDHRAQRARRDDQHHDARRPGARRRHPGRRRDGGDREHQLAPRAGQGARAGDPRRRRSRSPSRRSSRRCASASCSCRCSSSPASPATCSCRWPKRSCSRCSRPTCCRGRWCRRWRSTCCKAHQPHGARPVGEPVRAGAARARRRLPADARGLPGDARARAWTAAALFAAAFLLVCVVSFALLPWVGQDFFPQVDSGQFKLHVRAPTGTRIEETALLCDEVDAAIRDVIPKKQLESMMDNIGLPYSGLNLSYSNSAPIGAQDADIMVALAPGHQPTANVDPRPAHRAARGGFPASCSPSSPPTSSARS